MYFTQKNLSTKITMWIIYLFAGCLSILLIVKVCASFCNQKIQKSAKSIRACVIIICLIYLIKVFLISIYHGISFERDVLIWYHGSIAIAYFTVKQLDETFKGTFLSIKKIKWFILLTGVIILSIISFPFFMFYMVGLYLFLS